MSNDISRARGSKESLLPQCWLLVHVPAQSVFINCLVLAKLGLFVHSRDDGDVGQGANSGRPLSSTQGISVLMFPDPRTTFQKPVLNTCTFSSALPRVEFAH